MTTSVTLTEVGSGSIVAIVTITLINLIIQIGWAALSSIALSFGGYIPPESIQLWSLACESFRSVFKPVLCFAESQSVEFRDALKQIFDRDQFIQINDPLLI